MFIPILTTGSFHFQRILRSYCLNNINQFVGFDTKSAHLHMTFGILLFKSELKSTIKQSKEQFEVGGSET